VIEFIAAFVSLGAAFLLSLVNGVQTKASECNVHDGISYCYYAGSPETETTIYFLHGFANDQTAWSWNPVTKRIEKSWTKTSTPHPHIVAISNGRLWWYTKKEQGEKLTAFAQWIEMQKLGHLAAQRVLYGDSMGGHNAFRWASDQPRFFTRMALICPAIPFSFLGFDAPNAGWWPLNLLANRLILGRYAEAGEPFQSPLKALANRGKDELIPSIHIVATERDQFDFYRGDVALYNSLVHAGVKDIELEKQDVGHCNIQTDRIAAFLAH
jgi:pimeloyl-ACP methyl ester carboxylesterase